MDMSYSGILSYVEDMVYLHPTMRKEIEERKND